MVSIKVFVHHSLLWLYPLLKSLWLTEGGFGRGGRRKELNYYLHLSQSTSCCTAIRKEHVPVPSTGSWAMGVPANLNPHCHCLCLSAQHSMAQQNLCHWRKLLKNISRQIEFLIFVRIQGLWKIRLAKTKIYGWPAICNCETLWYSDCLLLSMTKS